jgi:hypothetical protein
LRAEVDGDRVTVAGAINATFGEPRVGPLAASVGSATASEA